MSKEIKKKKISFMDKYKTYDTSDGFGSPEQWKSAFEARMNFCITTVEYKETNKNVLSSLYEAKDATTLRKVYFELIKQYHPDIHGVGEDGSNEKMSQLINDTYYELKEKF